MIDGSSVCIYHAAATLKGHPDRCLRRSWGGLTTKIYALTDTDGLQVKTVISPGQTQYIKSIAKKRNAPHVAYDAVRLFQHCSEAR